MPRVVDHAQRRRDLAEAVWRVILRDGVQHASVRTVAAEAGWSTGSLRHYFATRSELLTFAMRMVNERVRARIVALGEPTTLVEGVVARCLEVLPLDAERRAEAEIWLALTGASLSDSDLREVRDESDDGMRELCRLLLEAMRREGQLARGANIDLEAERLRAMLDGLVLHMLFQPEGIGVDPESMVRRQVTELTRQDS